MLTKRVDPYNVHLQKKSSFFIRISYSVELETERDIFKYDHVNVDTVVWW